MCVCICVCMYVCECVVCVCMRVCVYMCVYVCVCVWVWVYNLLSLTSTIEPGVQQLCIVYCCSSHCTPFTVVLKASLFTL